MKQNNPVFILGAPRSGTTFLASLLSKTEFGAPFETQFITKYYNKLNEFGDLHQIENFQKLVNSILSERAVMQWNLKLDIKQLFEDLGSDFTYTDLVNALCLMPAKDMGYANWGDKTPHYLGDIEIIHKLFPNSKVIFIVRDGRDVALSLLERDWGPNNIYTSALYWKSLNRKQQTLEELQEKGLLLKIKYEELLNDIDLNCKRVFEFLGYQYNQGYIDLLTAKVKKNNFDKWKSKMNANQIKVFDMTAAETLKRFGYETRHEEAPLPFLTKWHYELHNRYGKLRHLFIINVIDGFKIKFLGKQPFGE
jgi:hypothetical protein